MYALSRMRGAGKGEAEEMREEEAEEEEEGEEVEGNVKCNQFRAQRR